MAIGFELREGIDEHCQQAEDKGVVCYFVPQQSNS